MNFNFEEGKQIAVIKKKNDENVLATDKLNPPS